MITSKQILEQILAEGNKLAIEKHGFNAHPLEVHTFWLSYLAGNIATLSIEIIQLKEDINNLKGALHEKVIIPNASMH